MTTTIIAGAGVIGLATALELRARGHQVIVLERGRLLEEASWAAAGMLAADDPENPSPLSEISRFSLALYPEFLERLQQLSGCSIPLRTQHTLQFCDAHHAPNALERLSDCEAVRRVPGLQMQVGQTALWLQEQSLDPRDLCRALASACLAVGVEIRQHTPLLSADTRGRQLTIGIPQAKLVADSLVIAMGAWSSSASLTDEEIGLPADSIFPRKGQMLRIKAPARNPLTTVLRAPSIYIVPRGDAGLVIGATVEDVGFDRAVRREATAWLFDEAARLWNPLTGTGQAQIEDAWTGIRPATPDHLPILGSLHHPRIYFATGHYRNGILLAPGTARIIAQLADGENPTVDLKPFDPARFASQTARL